MYTAIILSLLATSISAQLSTPDLSSAFSSYLAASSGIQNPATAFPTTFPSTATTGIATGPTGTYPITALPGFLAPFSYDASVIGADRSSTTLALLCHLPPNSLPSIANVPTGALCNPSNAITATYGPSGISIPHAIGVAIDQATVNVDVSCSIQATTSLSCVSKVEADAGPAKTTVAVTMAYASPLPLAQVSITAGTEKLAAASTAAQKGAAGRTMPLGRGMDGGMMALSAGAAAAVGVLALLL